MAKETPIKRTKLNTSKRFKENTNDVSSFFLLRCWKLETNPKMKNFKFILEPYKAGGKNRFVCPNCGKMRVFARYIDTETGEYLAEYVGKCNRVDNCGYHYTPGNYFQDNSSSKIYTNESNMHVNSIKSIMKNSIPLPKEYFVKSRAGYSKNNLIHFLTKYFDIADVSHLISKYHIGTSDFWPGSTVFWLIDITGKILGGQVVQFDPETGSTIKTIQKDGSVRRHTLPVYFALKKSFEKQSQHIPEWLKEYESTGEKFPIPFGLHQIKTKKSHVIGIVEAPKTAIICDAFYPKFTWMAIGSLTYLNAERMKDLKNYPIVLFPDASTEGTAYLKWDQKAQELRKIGFQVTVSDLLEKIGSEGKAASGMDLADAIIQTEVQEDHSDNPLLNYEWDVTEFKIDKLF